MFKVIFSDFWTKLMALFLAVFLWVYLDFASRGVYLASGSEDRDVVVPVTLNLPPGMPFVVDIEPKTVKIRVEGSKAVIDRMASITEAGKIVQVFAVLSVPASELRVGGVYTSPLGYSVIGVNPDELKVTIEPDKDVQIKEVKSIQ